VSKSPECDIGIHRSQPVVSIGRKRIRLSRAEHELLTALGMMDNRLMPHELLIETALENLTKIPADRHVLHQRITRLRKKIGHDRLQRKPYGYILNGDVYFFG
jgi:DNA-binding response OmpR family regulator